MTTVKRFDQYTFKGGAVRTQEGFLCVPALATRVGVLKYVKPDGSIRRELRLPEEVFKSESMRTLASKPVTYIHPKTLVDTDSAKEVTVGATGGVIEKVDNKFLKVGVTLFDSAAIGAVESGTDEVSCGYTCEHDETPGVWQGEPYDVIQRNIKYNHLAIVPRGRAGREIRLQLDSEDAVLTTEELLMKLVLNGKEFEVPDDLGEAIQAELEAVKIAASDSAVEGEKAKIDELNVEKEQLEAKADALNAEIKALKAKPVAKMDAAAVQTEGRAFAKAYVLAQKLNVKDVDSLDRQGLMKAVIKADSADFDETGKTSTYIEARFDMVAERLQKSDKAATEAGRTIMTNADASDAEAETKKAQAAYHNRLRGIK